MADTITAKVRGRLGVAQILDIDSADQGNAQLVHNELDLSEDLTDGTTPPVTKYAAFTLVLVAAAKTIDLTAVVDDIGRTIDFTGLKIQAFKFKPIGANAMTIAEGAATGYELLGVAFLAEVDPGGTLMVYLPDTAPDVAAGLKHIDVTGVGVEEAEVEILAG